MGFIHSLAWNRNGGRWSAIRKKAWTELAIGAGATEVFVEDTATGNPLTFLTDLARPLKSLLIPWTPTQTGSGDPSPENVRPMVGRTGCDVYAGGKNLIKDNADLQELYIPKGTQLFASYSTQQGVVINNPSVQFYKKDKTLIDYWTLNNNYMTGRYGRSFTLTEDAYWFAIITDYHYPIERQLEIGSSGSAYEPYAPITHTPVVFPAMGKNLFDASSFPFVDGFINAGNGGTGSSASYKRTNDYIPISRYAGQTLTLNKRPGGTNPGIAFYTSTSSGTFISGVKNLDVTAGTPMTFEVPSNAVYMRFSIPADATDIQIEKGSTATTYEPFTNTVYGGTLDVVSGVLTVEWWAITPKWSDRWYGAELENTERRTFVIPSEISINTANYYNSHKSEILCNRATWFWSFADDSVHFYTTEDQGKKVALVFLPKGTDEDTVIQIVGKLATPYTIQLTPQQINALVGNNTIWSDANGSMTAVYLKKG